MSTSRAAAVSLAAALFACADRKAPPPRAPAAPPANAPAAQHASAQAACIDRELASRGLNQFGDPPDTMYPGGTPLFDERTGQSIDRIARIVARHPDLAARCPAAPAAGRAPAP